MGRVLFAAVLGIVALLYLWLAFQAVFSSSGFLTADPVTSIVSLVIFLGIGVAAGIGSVNLLRQKSNR